MGLRMQNLNITGVHWKIWFLRVVHEKLELFSAAAVVT